MQNLCYWSYLLEFACVAVKCICVREAVQAFVEKIEGVQPNNTRILALRKVSIFSIKPPQPPFLYLIGFLLIYPQDFFRGSIKINIVLIVPFIVLLLLHFDDDITTCLL